MKGNLPRMAINLINNGLGKCAAISNDVRTVSSLSSGTTINIKKGSYRVGTRLPWVVATDTCSTTTENMLDPLIITV